MSPSTVPAVPGDPPDRRLWWPALGVWVGALVGVVVAVRCGAVVPLAAGAVVATVAGVIAWTVRTPRRRAVALAITAAGVGLVAACGRVAPLLSPAVADAVARGARVRLEAVVASDPTPVRPGGVGGQRGEPAVDVRVTVVRLSRGSVLDWTGSLPAALRAGSDAAGLLPGTRIRLVATPAPGDPLRGVGLRLRARSPVQVLADASPAQRLAGRWRDGLMAAVAGRPPDAAGLLPGLALGDVRGTPTDLADAMRGAGLAHLTAVSGANGRSKVGVWPMTGTPPRPSTHLIRTRETPAW